MATNTEIGFVLLIILNFIIRSCSQTCPVGSHNVTSFNCTYHFYGDALNARTKAEAENFCVTSGLKGILMPANDDHGHLINFAFVMWNTATCDHEYWVNLQYGYDEVSTSLGSVISSTMYRWGDGSKPNSSEPCLTAVRNDSTEYFYLFSRDCMEKHGFACVSIDVEPCGSDEVAVPNYKSVCSTECERRTEPTSTNTNPSSSATAPTADTLFPAVTENTTTNADEPLPTTTRDLATNTDASLPMSTQNPTANAGKSTPSATENITGSAETSLPTTTQIPAANTETSVSIATQNLTTHTEPTSPAATQDPAANSDNITSFPVLTNEPTTTSGTSLPTATADATENGGSRQRTTTTDLDTETTSSRDNTCHKVSTGWLFITAILTSVLLGWT